ncbi:MAG: glycosyltransferase, partial [Mangrovicoccus sp.]
MTRRIAHLVELSGGGPTTVALNYIQGQRAQGDEVHLIACRNLISEDLKTKIGTDLLYTSSRNPAQFPRVAKEVAALIDRVAPDVLHLHSAFAGVYGRMALSHLAVPRPAVVYCSHCWAFNQ